MIIIYTPLPGFGISSTIIIFVVMFVQIRIFHYEDERKRPLRRLNGQDTGRESYEMWVRVPPAAIFFACFHPSSCKEKLFSVRTSQMKLKEYVTVVCLKLVFIDSGKDQISRF